MRDNKNCAVRYDKFCAVDLFAGCGGLSEGFQQAGFEVIAGIEMNKWACESLRTRYLFHELKKMGKVHLYHKYITGATSIDKIFDIYPDIKETISKRVIQATLGVEEMSLVLQRIKSSLQYHGESGVHVLLGGPPCQPYSLMGRARDPQKMENDDRHYLYRHYLEIIEGLKPDFFVYENVPGLFTARAGGQRIFSKLLGDFSSLNPPYAITPPLERVQEDPGSYILDSATFGVPQHRKRLILIGYRKSLETTNPCVVDIFKKLQETAIRNERRGHLTVQDAIGDLPSLRPSEGNDDYYGRYSWYRGLRPYQIKMRRYSPGVLNHRARKHMEADLQRYRFFIECSRDGNKAVTLKDLIGQRPELTPNHRNLDEFQDRFKVQSWRNPSSTITAHISKDGHYYIHPDINQCRTFTVREAARCQSFPDNFKFEGPRTEQFKQVGNAVPPLLGYKVAMTIAKELRKIYGK